MEVVTECCCDWLEIRDGKTNSSRMLGRYQGTFVYPSDCGDIKCAVSLCKSPLPQTTDSTGRFVLVKFHSDSSGSFRGFKLKLRALNERAVIPTEPSYYSEPTRPWYYNEDTTAHSDKQAHGAKSTTAVRGGIQQITGIKVKTRFSVQFVFS